MAKELEKKLLEIINHHWRPHLYIKECDIFYAGQIPMGAIYIEKGPVYLMSRAKKQVITEPGIYFLNELLQEVPLKYNVRVSPESKIYILDRYTIKNLFNVDSLNYA
jgi:hypothetical protein